MKNISNRNILTIERQAFSKQAANPQGTKTEFTVLKYLADNTNIRVPQAVEYDEGTDVLRMAPINGTLLVTLLRNLDALPLDTRKLGTVRQLLLNRYLEDLEAFHSQTDAITDTFGEDIKVTHYPYTSNLMTAVEIIAGYLDETEINPIDQGLLDEINGIGVQLEANSSVLNRDPGLYNLLTETPTDLTDEQWLASLFETNDPEQIVQQIYDRTYHIDFETAHQLVCREDDQSLVLGSSVNQELPLIPEKNRRNEVAYLATIYRYLRVAARHAQYLFDDPVTYKGRYSHYGSIRDESPIYFLDTVLRVFDLADLNDGQLGKSTRIFVKKAIAGLTQRIEDSLKLIESEK